MDYINKKLGEEYHRTDLWYYLAFGAGILIRFDLKSTAVFWFLACTGFFVCLFFILRKNAPAYRFALGISAGFFLGIAVCSFKISTLGSNFLTEPLSSEIEGEIISVNPSNSGRKILLGKVSILKTGGTLEKIRLSFKEKFLENLNLEAGDAIRVRARLLPTRKAILPGSYDFGLFAAFEGIGSGGYVTSRPEVISKAEKIGFDKIIADSRESLYGRLVSVAGKGAGNFIAAMSLGETKGMGEQLRAAMRNAGISHILCVSGLHLSLVASVIFLSTRFLLNIFDFTANNINVKTAAAFCSLAGSYLYLKLSGSQIAATRAFVMTSFFIISVALGRRPFPLRSLFIAGAFILAADPQYLFHPSFRLSFVAVLSLIAGYELYVKKNSGASKAGGIFYYLRSYFYANIYSGFLAGVATAPVAVSQFYIFPTYSILANLVAVPVASFAIMPAVLLFFLAFPFGLDAPVIKFIGFFTDLLSLLALKIEGLPHNVIYFGNITPLSLSVFTFGFCWICLWGGRIRFFGLFFALAGVILMFFSPKPSFIYDPVKKILFLEKEKGEYLAYYSKKTNDFTVRFVANWLGERDLETLPMEGKRFFELSDGKSLALNYRGSECLAADFQINMGEIFCKGAIMEIDKETLRKYGTIVVFCGNGNCELKYEDDSEFMGSERNGSL